MGNYGFKVSLPGYNVLDQAPGSLNLSVDTEANTLKLKAEGDSSAGAAIAHGMGAVPLFLSYVTDSNLGERRISTPFTSASPSTANSTYVAVDNGMYYTTHYLIFYPE